MLQNGDSDSGTADSPVLKREPNNNNNDSKLRKDDDEEDGKSASSVDKSGALTVAVGSGSDSNRQSVTSVRNFATHRNHTNPEMSVSHSLSGSHTPPPFASATSVFNQLGTNAKQGPHRLETS